ncbi:MAG: hypothetical protein Q8R67_12135 [Rhodoferax sp.]|nr:hypothetical protein [Rhodoferax sp.]MDP3652421.1 hypothetical protein [Rhodoferax sp.]
MDLDLVIARLKATLTGLKSIGTSVDLDAAIDGVVAVPAAFVLPLADSATPIDMAGSTDERETGAFGVVHVVSNRRDAQGAAALNDLKTLRLNLRAALVGWVPDAATGEPVHRTTGRLLRMDGNGRLWWIDEFQLITYYRST